MSKVSRDDQPADIEFSTLSSGEISQLAKDYISEKQELEKAMRQVSVAKAAGVTGGIAIGIASLLGSSVSLISILPAVALISSLIGLDTESVAEKINEIKIKRKNKDLEQP